MSVVFSNAGLVKAAPAFQKFPVRSVWSDFIAMRGGSEPTADYYWDVSGQGSLAYPTTGDSYATVAALNTALTTALPGSVSILDNGEHDGNPLIPGDRTDLTVAAETKGGVTFDDDNEFQCDGDGNRIMGFKQALLDINGDDNLIAYHQINNSTAVDKIYVLVDGHRNRICYSELENGEVQLFNVDAATARLYNRFDHMHLLRHLGGRSGASEIAQYGQAQQGIDYFTLTDSNYALDHDPNAFVESECLSNKSGSNAFIHNAMIRCLSIMNDRTATDSLWYGNLVDGGGLALSAGFSIQLRAILACNIIMNTNSSDLVGRMAMDFSKGGTNNHQAANNAQAAFNTISECFRCISFGRTGLGTDLATDPSLIGNAVINADAVRDSIWLQDFDGTLTTLANVIDPPVGITQSGILAERPEMTLIQNIPVPDDGGNCHGTGPTTGYNSIITVDFMGNLIPASSPNVGAIQPGYNLSMSPLQRIINESGVAA